MALFQMERCTLRTTGEHCAQDALVKQWRLDILCGLSLSRKYYTTEGRSLICILQCFTDLRKYEWRSQY